jgi:hypothetical protein
LLIEAPYITRISPFVKEISLVNNFEVDNIFHDLSLHLFEESMLAAVTTKFTSFWEENTEPETNPQDPEVIASKKEESSSWPGGNQLSHEQDWTSKRNPFPKDFSSFDYVAGNGPCHEFSKQVNLEE